MSRVYRLTPIVGQDLVEIWSNTYERNSSKHAAFGSPVIAAPERQ